MCRSGTTSAYNFGNMLNGDKANVDGNYPFGMKTTKLFLNRSTNVGSYEVNRFGLYDVHGNVDEWCFHAWDLRQSGYDSRSETTQDPVSFNGSEIITTRGGAWPHNSSKARSADRSVSYFPNDRVNCVGFRVVR